MSARFLADNDVDPSIVSATLRLEPSINFRAARAASLDGVPDIEVLRLAAAEHRILVSCDRSTMAIHLARLLVEGADSPSVLVIVPQSANIGKVARTRVMIWAASDPKEWANKVTKIPF